MGIEQAMFTALPNGLARDGRSLRLSVYVTPRLKLGPGDADELREFTAFERWPTTLDDVQFLVEVDGLSDPLATEPDPESPKPEQATWDLLFPPGTRVASRQFDDLADRRLRSFPLDEVQDHVLDLYAGVAAQSPDAFPSLSGIANRLGRLGYISRYPGEFYGPIESLFTRTSRKGGGAVDQGAIDPGSREELAFAQTYRFYDRPGARIGPNDPVPPEPDPPKLDFHSACAYLADYPELMRRLGLVVDLVFNADVPARGRLRLLTKVPTRLNWTNEDTMRPWTRYVGPPERFLAEPRKQGDLEDGMLDLGNERFFVTDLDVDGSGLKYVDFAATAARLEDHKTSGDPDAISLPALRNAGITVARRNRAMVVAARIADASDRDAAATPAELFADDVTRGYRVDVVDDRSARWRSLCLREGRYVVDRGTRIRLDIGPDEGYVKGASASATPAALPGAQPDLYVHQAVFGWDGWSIVAPRPGRVFPTHRGETTTPETDNPCGLTVTFTPQEGSLPALRYGVTYRVEARAVDLAGNSLPFDEGRAPGRTASPPLTYRRWEPVPAPTVVPRRPFGEGESLMRMVIRSTLDETTASYCALERVGQLPRHEKVSGLDQLDRSYRPRDERHLTPPKTALQMAETHGALDPALGDRPQQVRDDFLAIALREAGTLLDIEVSDPANPTIVQTLGYVHVVNADKQPTQLPLSRRGVALKEGEYIVHDTDQLLLPYLPDVLARGASLTGLPGHQGTWLQQFGGDWPDRRPFRIEMVEGNGAPAWDPDERRLTVSLPQAEVAHVQLSCHLDRRGPKDSDLDVLAVWALLTPDMRAKLEALALEGLHWMLTPPDELVLVHAVEKPLALPVPVLTDRDLHRFAGETFASLTGTLAVHAKSTGRLDLDATWKEPLDDLARPGPTTIDGHAHAADFRIEPVEDTVQLGRDDSAPGLGPIVHSARHQFGDTKHRLVTYMATATTRFREYFPPEITDDPELITQKGPAVTVHVPSSRRPDPPEVQYLVPTFRWEQRELRPRARGVRGPVAPTGIERTRLGGGLRVYLSRPWCSSGADEHLAVVLPNQPPPIRFDDLKAGVLDALADIGIDQKVLNAAVRRLDVRGLSAAKLAGAITEAVAGRAASTSIPPPFMVRSLAGSLIDAAALDVDLINLVLPSDVTPFVTRWGMDPIWAGPKPPSGPRIQSFPQADHWDTGLSLAEAPGGRVAAAAFVPQYDPDRRLWYCDIDVDAGDAYFPFIRLALARYQPYSISGTHLSRTVLAEFAQLTPDRMLTVRPQRDRGLMVGVEGVAAANDVTDRTYPAQHLDREGLPQSRLVVAQIERLRDSATDVGWEPVGRRIPLAFRGLPPGGASWSGVVPTPEVETRFRYRLAVEEYELYETDESQAEYHETTATPAVDIEIGWGIDVTGIRLPVSTPLRGRLIYADHVALAARDDGPLVPQLDSGAEAYLGNA